MRWHRRMTTTQQMGNQASDIAGYLLFAVLDYTYKKNAQHGVKHAVRFALYKATKQEKEFERERKKKTCFVIPQLYSGLFRFLMVVLYYFDV